MVEIINFLHFSIYLYEKAGRLRRPVRARGYNRLSADVLSIFTISLVIVFLKNTPVTQTCIFGISQNFRPFAFIEILSIPIPKASTETIIANFRIILQKR